MSNVVMVIRMDERKDWDPKLTVAGADRTLRRPSWQKLVAEEKVALVTAAKCMSLLIIMLASFCHQYVFPSTGVRGEPGPLSLSSKKSFICLEPELGKSRGWHCLLSSGSHSKTSQVYGRSIKTLGTVDVLRFPRASLKVHKDFQI